MKATVPTLAPALAAVVAIVLLWTAPAQAAEPEGDKAGPPAAKQTVSADDIHRLAAELYNEGAEAQQAGKLQTARAKFSAVLSLNPKHLKAKAALAAGEKQLGITAADRLKEQLDTQVAEVDFDKAPLREVVDYLAHEADINIVFHADALNALAAGQPQAAEQPAAPGNLEAVSEEPLAETVPAAPGMAPPAQPRTDLITIHLKNVPLKEVLRYVLRYKGLRYIVEEYAVLIVPIGWEPPDEMEMEVFRLATGTTGTRHPGLDQTDQTGF